MSSTTLTHSENCDRNSRNADARHEARGRRHPRFGRRHAPSSFTEAWAGGSTATSSSATRSGRAVHASGLAVPRSISARASRRPRRARRSGLYLVVSDIEAARAELIGRGVEVSEVFHRAGPGKPPVSGRHPERQQLLLLRHLQGSGRQRAGCCRRSPRGSRAGSTPTTTNFASRSGPCGRACGARRLPTASTRSATAASATRTGPTGTPNTWWRSRPASRCRL